MPRTTAAAVGLATFAFINVVLFIVLAHPYGMLTDIIIEQANPSHLNVTSGNVTAYLTNFQIVFGLMFLFSIVGLIIWFLLGSHELEGEEYS